MDVTPSSSISLVTGAAGWEWAAGGSGAKTAGMDGGRFPEAGTAAVPGRYGRAGYPGKMRRAEASWLLPSSSQTPT